MTKPPSVSVLGRKRSTEKQIKSPKSNQKQDSHSHTQQENPEQKLAKAHRKPDLETVVLEEDSGESHLCLTKMSSPQGLDDQKHCLPKLDSEEQPSFCQLENTYLRSSKKCMNETRLSKPARYLLQDEKKKVMQDLEEWPSLQSPFDKDSFHQTTTKSKEWPTLAENFGSLLQQTAAQLKTSNNFSLAGLKLKQKPQGSYLPIKQKKQKVKQEPAGPDAWDKLFSQMQANSRKQITVHPLWKNQSCTKQNIQLRTFEQIMRQVNENSFDQTMHIVDLHGFAKREAIYQVSNDISRIEKDLAQGMVQPNVGNGQDHIFMIICGKGLHSVDKSYAIKNDIHKWLVSRVKPRKLPFWHDMITS